MATAAVETAPDDDPVVFVFTVAAGGALAVGGTLRYSGQSVYLTRAQAAPLLVRGVVVAAPPNFAPLSAEEQHEAAVRAMRDLEQARNSVGYSLEPWLSANGHMRRQYERVVAALKAFQEGARK